MQDRALYSIQEARKLLGGISRNTIYRLLRTGQLASVVIGCRRFISPAAIAELVAKSTTTISPSLASTRSRYFCADRGERALYRSRSVATLERMVRPLIAVPRPILGIRAPPDDT
jgi:excisionase family DNA binding protein